MSRPVLPAVWQGSQSLELWLGSSSSSGRRRSWFWETGQLPGLVNRPDKLPARAQTPYSAICDFRLSPLLLGLILLGVTPCDRRTC